MKKFLPGLILLLPAVIWAEIPNFINKELLAKPEKIMLTRVHNDGVGDTDYFTQVERRLHWKILGIKRFETTDNTALLVNERDIIRVLKAEPVTNREGRSGEEESFIIPYLDEVEYILVPHVFGYYTNLSINKIKEIELITNKDGKVQELEHYKIKISSEVHLSYKIMVVSALESRIIEVVEDEVTASLSRTFNVEEYEYSGMLLLDILGAIIRENRLSSAEDKAGDLLEKAQASALDKLDESVKQELNESRTFKVATRIIHKQDRQVYFNQGELWEIRKGGLFSIQQRHLNSTLLEVDLVDTYYSRAGVLWGQVYSNQVAVPRKVFGFSFQLGSGWRPARINPDLEHMLLSTLGGTNTGTVSWTQVYINTIQLRMGMDQFKKFFLHQEVELHFTPDLNFIAWGLSAGYKWQFRRLSVALGMGFSYNYFGSSFDISLSTASNLNMEVQGNEPVSLNSYVQALELRPQLELRLYAGPRFAIRVNAAYSHTIGTDTMYLSATQLQPDSDSTDEVSRRIFESSVDNRYLLPGNWSVSTGIMLVF